MPFSDCLASRTQVTIILWENTSIINLKISTLLRVETFSQTCHCINVTAFFLQASNLIWLKWKEGKTVSNFFIYTRRETEIFHLKAFWHLTVYKVVSKCMTGVISSNQEVDTCWNVCEIQVSIGFSLYFDDRSQSFPLWSENLDNWITQNI